MGVLTGILGTAGVASAVSGAAGIGSSIASNRKNQQIAQMNNEFNERMLDKQINYNREAYQTQLNDTWKFWNATNEYNSPNSQLQRFRDAGLNPYLAIDNAGIASVQSAPSQQGINPPTATPVQADYSGIGHAIANAVGIYNQTKLSNEQTQHLKLENEYYATRALLEFKEKAANIKDKELRNQFFNDVYEYEKRIRKNIADKSAMDVTNARFDMKLKSQEIIANSERLRTLPQQLKNDLILQMEEIASYGYKNKLTNIQAKKESQSILNLLQEYNITKNMSPVQLEQAKTELTKAIRNDGWSDPTGVLNIVSQFFKAIDKWKQLK